MKRRAILAFTLDHPGVLNKISMLIRKKNVQRRYLDRVPVKNSRGQPHDHYSGGK